ncbi:MAG: hypothetical protein ACK4Q5_18355, partial [Saprospiraceae bacterium]
TLFVPADSFGEKSVKTSPQILKHTLSPHFLARAARAESGSLHRKRPPRVPALSATTFVKHSKKAGCPTF